MDQPILRRLLSGAAAGAIATGVMTLHMVWARATGRVDRMSPERVTDAGLAAAGVDRTTTLHAAGTSVAHLGFGVATGALYSVLARGRRRPWWSGGAYGIAVAAVSYQGWVPAAGILPPLSRAPAGRRNEVLVSHLVYGTVLAVMTNRLMCSGSGRSRPGD